jgi:hypothetical protein
MLEHIAGIRRDITQLATVDDFFGKQEAVRNK